MNYSLLTAPAQCRPFFSTCLANGLELSRLFLSEVLPTCFELRTFLPAGIDTERIDPYMGGLCSWDKSFLTVITFLQANKLYRTCDLWLENRVSVSDDPDVRNGAMAGITTCNSEVYHVVPLSASANTIQSLADDAFGLAPDAFFLVKREPDEASTPRVIQSDYLSKVAQKIILAGVTAFDHEGILFWTKDL